MNNFNSLMKKNNELLEKYGWLVHFVYPDENNRLANIHTHVFEESWGHLDIQIVLPIEEKIAHYLLTNIADRVKQNEKFEVGKLYDKIINNFQVYFVLRKEKDRTVLRLILPDALGKFPNDKDCAEFYNEQEKNSDTVH
jgi:hypothetical protein